MLLRNGKNKGESLCDSLVASRQKYLEALDKYKKADGECYRLSRLRDKAYSEFSDVLNRFDDFFGGGEK